MDEQNGCWSNHDERVRLENLIGQRFTFLLVFVSIVVGAAAAAKNRELSASVLAFGTVLCLPLLLATWRAKTHLNYLLKKFIFQDKSHIATKLEDELPKSWVGSTRNYVGRVIPVICLVGPLLATLCAVMGWLGFGVS